MQKYQPRKLAFRELHRVDDWQIKIYTIAKHGDFTHPDFYENAKKRLPEWLKMHNSFAPENDKIGFLILHAGTEGIFTLVNWWVGRNMLNTHIFLTEYVTPDTFKLISGDGMAPCIWEAEIIDFERRAWIDFVLKKKEVDFLGYLGEFYREAMY